jgi:hypothetical protein
MEFRLVQIRSTIRLAALAVTALVATSVGSGAKAAIGGHAVTLPAISASAAPVAPMLAHWEYRHHRRFWVPDRRRFDRRDYRR